MAPPYLHIEVFGKAVKLLILILIPLVSVAAQQNHRVDRKTLQAHVSSGLQNSSPALTAALLCWSYSAGTYDDLGLSVYEYESREKELNKRLDSFNAQNKVIKLKAADKKAFLEGKGPFYVGNSNVPLQEFIKPGVQYMVEEVKQTDRGLGAFVRLEYDRAIAPVVPSLSPKPIKTIYLIVPVAEPGMITATFRGPNIFAPTIGIVSATAGFWDIPNLEQLLTQSKIKTREIGAYKGFVTLTGGDPTDEQVWLSDVALSGQNPDNDRVRKSLRSGNPPEGFQHFIWFGDIRDVTYRERETTGFGSTYTEYVVTAVYVTSYGAVDDYTMLLRDKSHAEKMFREFSSALESWRQKFKKAVDENPRHPILMGQK